jgi:hypothetical protein
MLPDLNYLYFPTFFWGIANILAYIGFGRLVCVALGADKNSTWGWGLHGIIGMCFLIFFGGILLFLQIGNSLCLTGIVVLGAGLWTYQTFKDFNNPKYEFDFSAFIKNLPLWLLVSVYYFGSVAWIKEIDPNDDLPGYFVFPHAILQMGTLLEEFSMRRACTFGGHQLLQAMTSVFGSEKNFQFVDIGIAKVLLFGLVSQALAGLRKKHYWVYLISIALVLFLHYPRINASGLQLPVVISIALAILILDQGDMLGKNWTMRHLVLPGLLIAGASTFRPQYALFAGAFFALWNMFSKGPRQWKSWAAPVAVTGVLSLVLLVPWMALLYKSIGTPFMPPFLGGVNPVFLGIHAVQGEIPTKILAAIQVMLIPELLVFLTGLLAFLVLRFNPTTLSLCLAGAVTMLIFAYSWSAIPPTYFYRYSFPFFAAFWIPILIQTARETAKQSGKKLQSHSALYVWLAMVGIVGFTQFSSGAKGFHLFLASIPGQISNRSPLFPKENYLYHRELQNAVPPGEPIFVMVDAPFMFDFKRNRIYNAEAVGQCSPWGGLPFFKGPESLKEYLTANGIKNVIFVKPEAALMYYRKDYWENNPWVRQGFGFIAEYGKYVIDLSNNLTTLARASLGSKETQSHYILHLE